MVTRRTFISAPAAVLLLPTSPPGGASERLTVFAAASLKTALDKVAAAWQASATVKLAISYAASSALARQIEEGAPADVFFSADRDWMKNLTGKNLIKPGTTVELLGNEIVLIAPADSKAETIIAKDFPLASLLGDGRLAMADIKAVPAGKYGKAALETLGVWSSVENRIAQAENVRAALKLVATGETPFGIVYKTDAIAEPSVRVIGTFPAESHPPIIYPVGVVANSQTSAALEFVNFLQTAKAQAIFNDEGFTVLVPTATN